MLMNGRKRLSLGLLVVSVGFLASGCASTKGSYNAVMAPKGEEQLAKYSNLKLEVDCKNDVPLSPSDRERILDLIVKNLSTECAGRFKTVNPQSSLPDTLHASVVINKYDEGNAFARAMLAGLGQMHIDADVVLTDPNTKEQIARYDVSKTFAWGGVYGGIAGIKDIEDGFSKAVAGAIAGKKQE